MAFAYRTLIADAGAPDTPLADPSTTGMVDTFAVGADKATIVRNEWGADGWQMIQASPAQQDPTSTVVDFSKAV